MTHSGSSPGDITSEHLEKVVLERLRQQLDCLPIQCQLYREIWDHTTLLCVDIQDCPDLLNTIQNELESIIQVSHNLGLARSVVCRLDQKVLGWKTLQS